MEYEATLSIIRSSNLEDVIILDANYDTIIHDLADSDERTRYVKLKSKVQDRICELTHG